MRSFGLFLERLHVHKAGWPRNPTEASPEYDPSRWRYTCEECGVEAKPSGVSHRDGWVAIGPPKDWR